MAGRAVRIGNRESPEVVERRFELATEVERVETLVERFEFGALGGRQDPGRAHALIPRLGDDQRGGARARRYAVWSRAFRRAGRS